MEKERRDRFDVRLLELKDPFYDYIEANSLRGSEAVRHFIKQGISESKGLTYEQQNRLITEVIELKRAHGAIGTNLNQIARYFNQHNHLIESELHKVHLQLLQNQKDITIKINEIMKLI